MDNGSLLWEYFILLILCNDILKIFQDICICLSAEKGIIQKQFLVRCSPFDYIFIIFQFNPVLLLPVYIYLFVINIGGILC